MNNIFLTGDRGVGKSTLLQKIMAARKSRYDGVRTLPYHDANNMRLGFYITDLSETVKPSENSIICRMDENFWPVPQTEGFEKTGVKLLLAAEQSGNDSLIIDELGFLETQAAMFQKAVFSCLDSEKTVLGVIKNRESEFLNTVRRRSDVRIFVVTEQNRETLQEEILAALERLET